MQKNRRRESHAWVPLNACGPIKEGKIGQYMLHVY
jgi:hypothetical protein